MLVNEQITFTNQKIFEKIAVNDLKKLIKKMNLKNVPEFKETEYYHVVFRNTLTNIGLQPITVLLVSSRMDTSSTTVFYLRNVNAVVYAKNGYCLPKVYSEDCNIPSNAQTVLYHHSNSFKPIVERECSKSSKLIYKWSINHLLDTSKFNYLLYRQNVNSNFLEMYDALSDETHISIKFPPYTLWYDDIKEVFVSFYALKLNVLEVDHENKRSGMAISRVRTLSSNILCFL